MEYQTTRLAGPRRRCNLLVVDFDEIRIQGGGATGNLVEGNYIGTDGSLQMNPASLFSGLDAGVLILDASGNIIGGAVPGSGNVIEGDFNGILIRGQSAPANGNLVQGNYIGTNATGSAFLTDALSIQGIWIELNANGNTIGGTTAAVAQRHFGVW